MIYKSRLKTVIISAFETNGQGVERLRRDFLERDKSIQNGQQGRNVHGIEACFD
jgi:hypothetical protein